MDRGMDCQWILRREAHLKWSHLSIYLSIENQQRKQARQRQSKPAVSACCWGSSAPPFTPSPSLCISFKAFSKQTLLIFWSVESEGCRVYLCVRLCVICVCVRGCVCTLAGLTSGKKNHNKELAVLSSLAFLKKTLPNRYGKEKKITLEDKLSMQKCASKCAHLAVNVWMCWRRWDCEQLTENTWPSVLDGLFEGALKA